MSEFIVIANAKQGGNKHYFSMLTATLQQTMAVSTTPCKVVVLPPMPYLSQLASTEYNLLSFGAQVVRPDDQPAVTGGVTAAMVADSGGRFVCCGHSERRIHCHDNDEVLAMQYDSIVCAGLTPIYCVGETAEQRQAGQTLDTLEAQLAGVFSRDGFDKLPKHDIVIAYEPVWAIGAQKAAQLEDVESVFLFLQRYFSGRSEFGKLHFCYGGSVDHNNCQQFYQAQYVSGLLVGRCCLNINDFVEVVKQCSGS